MFSHYSVSPIALTLLVIYAASFTLYKTKVIKITTHRKVWNVLLLLTFFTTALFGLILAIRRDYALLFSFPINLLYWHVETGIVMTIVSIFHVSWHLGYYTDLLRSARKRTEVSRPCEQRENGLTQGGEKRLSWVAGVSTTKGGRRALRPDDLRGAMGSSHPGRANGPCALPAVHAGPHGNGQR